MQKTIVILGLALVAGVGIVLFGPERGGGETPVAEAPAPDGEMVEVRMPELDDTARTGQRAFAAKCAACHGPNAGGIEGAGPPLVHKIYEPGHHGDAAFYLAAARGVTAHHWRFGNMPPVEGITEAEVASIVAFVRRVQRANGIE